MARVLILAVAALSVVALAQRSAPDAGVAIRVRTPMAASRWATLERQLLSQNVPAAREFFEKYFDDRGYMRAVVRWGANDGPDDAFENFNRWPELHALDASDDILRMYSKFQRQQLHHAQLRPGSPWRQTRRPRPAAAPPIA